MFENIKSLIFSAVSLLFSFLYYHSDSIISLFTQNLGEAVLETIDEVILGSRLAAAIGIDPYTSQHDLKLILAKKKTPFFSDYCKKAMEHGKRQEPIAREFYFSIPFVIKKK
ncbi:hypothetical protein ACTFIR_004545 [Dictyostelium discoideum]